MTTLDLPAVSRLANQVLDEVERAVVGKRQALTLVLSGVLAGGHVLIEDLPGLGKTLAARSFATTLGLTFTRAQFTPDLLPADLTGSFVYDQRTAEFVFRRGPLFTGLLLADEINRTPPKTQATLLEAMQERQITVEGQTFALDAPFHVLATANPVEYEGTYPLPEAQLDRFLLRISFGYPTHDDEWEVLRRRIDRGREEQSLQPITDAATVLAMQAAVETVTVDDSISRYCVDLASATRRHQHVLIGSSPRGALALMLVARALAVLRGRDFVVPEDVKAAAVSVLVHRITVKPELWMTVSSAMSVVHEVLASVPAPAAREAEHPDMIVPGWQPTVAHVRAGAGGAMLAVAGALVRRPDAVVLAVPLLVIACWGTVRRPRRDLEVSDAIGHATLREGEATTWHIDVRGDPDIDVVGAVLWAPPYAELDPPWGEAAAAMTPVMPPAGGASGSAASSVARFDIGLRSTRWGRRYVGPARVVASSVWAAFRWTSGNTTSRLVTTLPLPAVFDGAAPATHAAGLVGLDRSVRPGDGSEFSGIRPFQAGDRLRRIHWPRSLRSGSLHVTSTWADHDRHIVLVVDAFNDVGDSDGIDGRASSLDTTVRAAGALAEHHLRRGDRVALTVLGARGGVRVPAATGTRHLRRVLDALATVEPATAAGDDARLHLGLTGGSLVMMLSPMVSVVPLQRAIALAGRGIAVVVVDTLPDGVTDADPDDPLRALAWRIRLLERARELRAVRAAGIPVVTWRGPGSLDQVLRDLARRRSAPRVARR